MTTLPQHFRNQVVLGDVMDTLRALPDNSLNMVYGDPDYGVGINYAGKRFTKQWHEYVNWYIELAKVHPGSA